MQSKYLNMFFNALMFIGQYKFLENMRLNVCVCVLSGWLAANFTWGAELKGEGKSNRGQCKMLRESFII